MKVGLIHYNFEGCGGAEHVCLNTIKALHDNGFTVGLCTIGTPNYERILEFVGINIKDYVDYLLLAPGKSLMPYFKIYQYMTYSYFAIKNLWKEFKPDFIMVTQWVAVVPHELVNRTITYIHYPIDLTNLNGNIDSEWNVSGFLSKTYWKPVEIILETLDDYRDTQLITNSQFTSNAIREKWNRKATVIYPPCPLHLDLPLNRKKNWVCTLARFSSEKRYELALEISKQLPDVEFHFIGNVASYKQSYFRNLINQAESLKNVHFHPNVSLQEKREILKKSKVLLHAMLGEHFGISLLEGMSSGVTPVPHDSGGAKYDGFVPSGFRWETVEEAVDIIQHCIQDWNIDLAKELRMKSKKFSQENFQKNVVNFIRSLQCQS